MPIRPPFGVTTAAWRSWVQSPQLWLFGATVLLFSLFPQIDIAGSSLFRDPASGFTVGQLFAVRVLHEGWDIAARAIAVALTLYLVASFIWKGLAPRGRRRAATFLLAVLLIGPGLIVNTFKDTWGRARPVNVEEFGGPRRFTPALTPSDQCPRNCAFTSGHAAFGFWWMAPAFVDRRRRGMWLALGLALGLGIGLVRIAQGGHFLSDVLFSGWIVYGTMLAMRALILKRPRRRPAPAPA
jgi:lipid A 4'-phosphatase